MSVKESVQENRHSNRIWHVRKHSNSHDTRFGLGGSLSVKFPYGFFDVNRACVNDGRPANDRSLARFLTLQAQGLCVAEADSCRVGMNRCRKRFDFGGMSDYSLRKDIRTGNASTGSLTDSGLRSAREFSRWGDSANPIETVTGFGDTVLSIRYVLAIDERTLLARFIRKVNIDADQNRR